MNNRIELVGRDEIIKRIYDRVNGHDSVSIVGYDGMGKSSLLNHIISDFHKPNTLMVEIFDSEPVDTLDFYQTLFESLGREVEESSVIDINLKYELKERFFKYENFQETSVLRKTLNDVFYKLRRSGINTVLVIDDFDRMTKCINEGNKEDALENFKYLRNLSNNNRIKVRYVITSKKSIEAISEECMVSGLPGIFNNPIKLELLEDKDIKKYVFKHLSKYQYRISTYEDELIRRVGGRVPGILKTAVEVLLDYKKSMNELDSSYEAEFFHRVEERCDYIFKSYWKCITYEEQRLLKHLCCGEDISDIKESILEVAKLSCQDMKLLNEDDTFVSEAFMNYVKKAEVNKDTEEDIQGAIDILKKSNEIIKVSLEELWGAYDIAKKVMIEKLTTDSKIGAMDFEKREEYNQYISTYFKDQFEKYDMDIDRCELLDGMSIQNVWDRLDSDIKKQIIQAELLSHVYRDTGFDQSPSCNPYCTAFEAIINRKALKPVIQAMQKLHPEFEIKKPSKFDNSDDGLPNTMMIGEFRTLLNDYFFYIKYNYRDELKTDPILKVYELKFKGKLTDINEIRNACMHWEDINKGEKTSGRKILDVSHLDLLRKQMLGKDDISCVEYLLKLADACEAVN
ncbi:ATP-binding protein [Lutispora sp.]|uniref:ATP-binding protein n=1 Tax=Lutispora sp. TaxID=2828727 RepID=UPI0035669479